jgi:mono/diheme cytochrome c family protein
MWRYRRAGPSRRALAALLLAGVAILAGMPAEAGDATAGRRKAVQCQTCHGLDGL